MPAVIEDDFLGGVVFEFVYVGVDEYSVAAKPSVRKNGNHLSG